MSKGMAIKTIITVLIALVVAVALLAASTNIPETVSRFMATGAENTCMHYYGKDNWEDVLPLLARDCGGCDEEYYSSLENVKKDCCEYYCSRINGMNTG